MKTLCLYYTRTNTTKAAMEALAKLIGADVAEYTDGKDRSGVKGYIGACLASMKKTLPEVTIKGDIDLSSYDRVVIGMPIWAEGPCVIGKAFLNQYKERLPEDVYYVVTHMAKNSYQGKIEAMDKILGRESSGFISVATKNHDYLADIEEFAKRL
ncbi:MAG: hypothetical protein IKW01_01605 [Firmicutes bacterium]|nr:hypothetical protein [Bacillota bacterium]